MRRILRRLPLLLLFLVLLSLRGSSLQAGPTSSASPSPPSKSDPIQPDPAKTPGVVLTTDPKRVCVAGYSATVRITPVSMKRAVFAAYGIAWSKHAGYEVDHRLPLSLGGADVPQNLWPETRNRHIRENAWEKDKLESLVHRLVCIRHTMTLAEGQAIFLGDWLDAYHRLLGPL